MQFLFIRAMKAHLIFILIGMFLITTSCEDDDHEHDDEHTDADGFVLEDENGSEVYREFEGAIEGSVSLSVGDTLEISVHFLDHDGNEIEHEENDEHDDEEDELVVSENDVNIAIVEVEEHEEGEHHEMSIHVIGVSAGSTSFKLQLMHDNHADYTSTNSVPIVVN